MNIHTRVNIFALNASLLEARVLDLYMQFVTYRSIANLERSLELTDQMLSGPIEEVCRDWYGHDLEVCS